MLCKKDEGVIGGTAGEVSVALPCELFAAGAVADGFEGVSELVSQNPGGVCIAGTSADIRGATETLTETEDHDRCNGLF
jgi:hypothetical protein